MKLRILIALVLSGGVFLTFFSRSIKSEELQCSICGNAIEGTYYQYGDDKVICKRCNDKLPHCDRCEIPMKRWASIGPYRLCEKCAKEAPRCAVCKLPILDSCIQYSHNNKTIRICQRCNMESIHCDSCKVPITGSIYAFGAKNFCESCYKRLHKCSICKEPIPGRYWTYKTEKATFIFCDDCENQHPHCQICGMPFTGGYEIDGKKVCRSCQKILHKCSGCGKPIVDQMWLYPGSDKVFCNACQKVKHRCDVCGIPLGTKYNVISDGRRICDECSSTAVMNSQTLEQIYNQAASVMTKLGYVVKPLPPVTMSDRDQLEKLARDVKNGDPDRTTGLYRQRNGDERIYLISALPKNILIGVAAHELAHAWQAKNAPDLNNHVIREGFAEWISYQVLAQLGLKKEMTRIENRKDIYGQGFKKLKQIEKKSGSKGVIKFISES